MCKAFNKFYLSKADTATEPQTDESPQSSDNELETSRVKKRLKSLDIFRGIAIVLMIFVNSGGGSYWWIEHAIWNGLHFADLVFPWFLFIMGVCIPMSIKGQINRQVSVGEIVAKVVQVSFFVDDYFLRI
jgi:heparan-alpha-glucosaminide N-acetyltransferase